MIALKFNLETNTLAFVRTLAIKPKDVPVTIEFSSDPGTVSSLALALSSDATPPAPLAYLDIFSPENATLYSGTLNANDTRLTGALSGKGDLGVRLSVLAVINGDEIETPDLMLTVQASKFSGPDATEGGPDYYSEEEIDARLAALSGRTLQVANTAARLALTTADIHTGDLCRETTGRPQITTITCEGSTYAAAASAIIDLDLTGFTGSALSGVALYLGPVDTAALFTVFWFSIDGTGTAPEGDWGAEDGTSVHFVQVALAGSASDTAIATALNTAIDGEPGYTCTRTGKVLRITWSATGEVSTAVGEFPGVSGIADTFTLVQAGVAASHSLNATVNLFTGNAAAVVRTVGVGLTGSGDLPVTLPASTRTAAQVAALVAAAFSGSAYFTASAAGNTVTVSTLVKAVAPYSSALGFAVSTSPGAFAGGLYQLVNAAQIATEAGWALVNGGEALPSVETNAGVMTFSRGAGNGGNGVPMTMGAVRPPNFLGSTTDGPQTVDTSMAIMCNVSHDGAQYRQVIPGTGGQFFSYEAVYPDQGVQFNPAVAPVAITGITSATPPVVTAPGHGLANGQQVMIQGVKGSYPDINRIFIAHDVTSTTFSLYRYNGTPEAWAGYAAHGAAGYCTRAKNWNGIDQVEFIWTTMDRSGNFTRRQSLTADCNNPLRASCTYYLPISIQSAAGNPQRFAGTTEPYGLFVSTEDSGLTGILLRNNVGGGASATCILEMQVKGSGAGNTDTPGQWNQHFWVGAGLNGSGGFNGSYTTVSTWSIIDRRFGVTPFHYIGDGTTSRVGIFTATPTAALDVNGTIAGTGLRIGTSPPASATAAGTTGQITWASGYLYVCVATNTWRRVAISTW